MNKSLSIIIPVFNEESQLGACLRSVEAQTVQPDEVIIVDNNSTDRSMEIARGFPFVTVIRETRQGRGFAYSAGFNAAHGDILGRINGDSILLPDWVALVKRAFEADEALKGVAGLGVTDTLPGVESLATTIWPRCYYLWYEADFRTQTFWGACMAVDRQAWLMVRNDICTDDKVVHDDQDLGFLFAGRGFKVERNNQLRIRLRGQHYAYWPKFREYRRRQFSTWRWHERKGTFRRPELRRLPWWKPIALASWGTPVVCIFYVLTIIHSLPMLLRRR